MYLGIDVSKPQLDVALWSGGKSRSFKERHVRNDGSGLKRLLEWLAEQGCSAGQCRVVRAVSLFDGATITINDGRRAVVSHAL